MRTGNMEDGERGEAAKRWDVRVDSYAAAYLLYTKLTKLGHPPF